MPKIAPLCKLRSNCMRQKPNFIRILPFKIATQVVAPGGPSQFEFCVSSEESTLKIFPARVLAYLGSIALVTLLGACGGGSSTGTTTTPPPVIPPAPVAAAINLSTSATTVKSDNSDSTTITATVLNAGNAAISGVAVTFSADTGILSSGSVISDASGQAKVTFSAGGNNASSRTATITAKAGTVSSQIPIKIAGSTIDLVSNGTSLIIGGNPAALTVTVKNAGGTPISGTPVTLASSSNAGSVTITPASGTTNASGQFTAQIAGATAGTATVTVTAAGETRTIDYSVSGAATFGITSTSPASVNKVVALTINSPLIVNVKAPAGTNVVFASTLGTWDASGKNTITKSALSGSVSATLTSPFAGVATIQVFDAANATSADTLTASLTASVASAAKVTLQATPTVVSPSVGGNAGISSLVATVTDAAGNPVGGATVAFQILNPTGGGETVVPPVAQTASVAGGGQTLGQTKTTFTAGSLPSGASGVKIRASVVGTAIATGVAPSGNDASITIGGTAGSIAIGRATVIQDAGNSTAYVLPMSVLVADSNGNPVANTTVSLSVWPIAFSPGPKCAPSGFFFNEDADENLILDPNTEDGVRKSYPTGPTTLGTKDGQATPPNSAGGTLPATVKTDASGLATFNLTYTKSNALFIVARVRASTLVQGTETVGQTSFGLPALLSDIGPPCLLPDSPYQF